MRRAKKINMQNTVFRFNPGDIAYVPSRYDGLVKVQIVAQIETDSDPCYELDKLVKVSKNVYAGAKTFRVIAGRFFNEYEHTCLERFLMAVGDPLKSNFDALFGAPGGPEILTEGMVKNL